MKTMATVSVNMERYNEVEVGVSYIWWWKGSVVWSMSASQGGCALMCGRGVELALQRGGKEVVIHQLTAQTVCALNRW